MPAEMRAIIYVPGMKPKPPAEIHRERLWQSLVEGLRRAQPEVAGDVAAHPDCFTLAAWGPLFYPETGDPSVDVPGLERLMSLSGPEPRDLEEARHWHKQLTRAMYLVADRLPFLIDLIAPEQLKASMLDSLRYLGNEDGAGERVRHYVAGVLEQAQADGRRILLLAHSLGSVIAWDVLWQLSRADSPVRIDQLVTIGSPLGLNFMRHRLLSAHAAKEDRYPRNIRRWVNLSAVGELTALDRSFANDYRGMLRQGLVESITDHTDLMNYFRGPDGVLNVHKCYGYMINPRTAEVVANWWQAKAPR
jgi:hypothetical protein